MLPQIHTHTCTLAYKHTQSNNTLATNLIDGKTYILFLFANNTNSHNVIKTWPHYTTTNVLVYVCFYLVICLEEKKANENPKIHRHHETNHGFGWLSIVILVLKYLFGFVWARLKLLHSYYAYINNNVLKSPEKN